jgi:hypothetical protein
VVVVSDPVTVSVTAVADTYANEGAKTANYATSWSLLSRGSIGGVSYLRFAVPATPAGKSLTGAVLKMRTSTDPLAGSVDQNSISTAANSWTETTLNWNNRPALGVGLGSTPANTSVNTSYQMPISVPAIQALAASELTIAISGTGTDSLWFWSSNNGTAADRPQLILTYQ